MGKMLRLHETAGSTWPVGPHRPIHACLVHVRSMEKNMYQVAERTEVVPSQVAVARVGCGSEQARPFPVTVELYCFPTWGGRGACRRLPIVKGGLHRMARSQPS